VYNNSVPVNIRNRKNKYSFTGEEKSWYPVSDVSPDIWIKRYTLVGKKEGT